MPEQIEHDGDAERGGGVGEGPPLDRERLAHLYAGFIRTLTRMADTLDQALATGDEDLVVEVRDALRVLIASGGGPVPEQPTVETPAPSPTIEEPITRSDITRWHAADDVLPPPAPLEMPERRRIVDFLFGTA
jgi:hypothetical protein